MGGIGEEKDGLPACQKAIVEVRVLVTQHLNLDDERSLSIIGRGPVVCGYEMYLVAPVHQAGIDRLFPGSESDARVVPDNEGNLPGSYRSGTEYCVPLT